MKKAATIVLGILILLMTTNLFAIVQKDDIKCKDHPMVTRMPDSWIHNCDEKTFDSYNFVSGKNKTVTVEGHRWTYTYYPQADLKIKPSEIQIRRNFENAFQKIGATVVGADKNKETFKVVKDGHEIWIELWAEFTGKYGFTIIQKEAMAQDIVASAQVFANDINTTGHAAIYGIYFDTNKSTIKPESAQAIAEVAKLLKSQPGLKVYVVGHTDNVGGVDSNLKLSQSRAEAVMKELAGTHGIAANRMRAFGCAQFAPVMSNDTEDGRAKNRRVELVKQ
jgi:OmpA-OmpF porin, OOP family